MAEIVLPTGPNEVVIKSPRKLVIYSPPKTGKTTLIAALQNCLLFDIDDGADFISAMTLKAKTYQDMYEICEKVKAAGRPYIYAAIDTTTEMETMAIPLALKLYQATAMGASYKGHILNLPNGGGYLYLRQAFEMILNMVEAAFDRVILLGHIKDKMIDRAGKEVNAKDIDLTGKIKQIVCAKADAIGYLYREGNKCIITFETSDDITCGARPLHLRNKKFILSEQDSEGNTKVYWDKIYID